MRSIRQPDDSSGSAAGEPPDETLAQQIVTLEKALAEERRARAIAERASRAKDEFLSVVSHEMRSPLNAILGWNRILAIKRAQDAEVAAVTPRIEQSARAQLKMVNDLLDFGRIGAGKLRISARPMKLSVLAGMAVTAARPAAEARGLVLALEPGPAGAIMGDADRLLQMLANLLSNAIRSTPRGGRILVRIRERADSKVELSVVDTGCGIPAQRLPTLFDRFSRDDGESSAQPSGSGLGLGLTLAREILALHGGSIAATSAGEGQGATFTVALPPAHAVLALNEPDGVAGTIETRPRQLAGLSILVVDDESDARAVVAETLRLEGASVTVGESARIALAHLAQPDWHFDVLVTDIGMPEEDGYSLVRKLRKLSAGENVVAIALTGFASQADVEAAIDAGFDLHVPKPVDFDSFVPIIRRLADRHA